MPSKSILYSLVMPKVFEATEKLSFPPYKIISMASAGMSCIGSVSLNSYRWAMTSNCLKIQVFFCSPMGTIPPFLIDRVLSGMIFFRLISFTVPNPLQTGQAPLGELNEKLLGSGIG